MFKKCSTIFLDEGFKNAVTKRLTKVLKNSTHSDFIFYNGKTEALPYVGITLKGADDAELQLIKEPFIKTVQAELNRYHYCDKTLPNWKYDYALSVPFLMVRYASNIEEKRFLEIGIKNDSIINNGGISNA